MILKPYDLNGKSLEIPFTDTAFFNATVAAKPFGKEPYGWLRSKEAQEYLDAFRKIYGTEQKQLVVTKRGGEPTEQGTWLHPDLGIPFARWLNPEFSVWADMQIKTILQGSHILPRPDRTSKALPGGLTIEQQNAVKALIKSRVEILPHNRQAKAAITCWSSIKSKFGVTYKAVPAEQFTEVLSLVARLPLEGELLKSDDPCRNPPLPFLQGKMGERFLIRLDGGGRYSVIPLGITEIVIDLSDLVAIDQALDTWRDFAKRKELRYYRAGMANLQNNGH